MKNSVVIGLVIVIVILVGVLGALTGYFVLPAQKTTTTQQTTTATTIQPTTIKTTIETTIQKVIIGEVTSSSCSPCFNYFRYVTHDTSKVELQNGQRTISISGVSYNPYEDILFPIDCVNSCDVEITYKIIDTGITHTDTATLHTYISNIALLDAYCGKNIIYTLIKNDGNLPINRLTFVVDGVINSNNELSGCMNEPLLPGKTVMCQVNGESGFNEIRVIGPSNAVGGTVECKGDLPLKTTTNIQLVDAFCRQSDKHIIMLVKNIGTDDVSSLTFVVNGKTLSASCNPTLPINSYETTSCEILSYTNAGPNELRVIGPSNAVGGTVSC